MRSPEANAGATRRSLLLAAAAGLAAARAGASTDEATLRALNEQYIAAGVADDKQWFERMLLDDFVCVLGDGRMIDKAAFLALPHTPLASSRLEDVRGRVHGDTGLVHARYVWAFADGRSGATTYTDVYVRKGGEWRVASAQLTRNAPPAPRG